MYDVKVIPSEECIAQHRPVICTLKIKKLRNIRRKFVPRRKIWKLDDVDVKENFKSCVG